MTATTAAAAVPAQATPPVIEQDAPALGSEAAESYELIRRIHKGDETAFEDVYRRFQPAVFKFVVGKVRHHQLAEDITQEVFLRAMRRITAFTWQGTSLAAWLVTIARNLVADHFKSSRFRMEWLSDDTTAYRKTPHSDDGLPEEETLAYLTELDLLQALIELRFHSEEQYEVLVCRFIKGLSVVETAAVMGKNLNATKAVQYRACKALARTMRVERGRAR